METIINNFKDTKFWYLINNKRKNNVIDKYLSSEKINLDYEYSQKIIDYLFNDIEKEKFKLDHSVIINAILIHKKKCQTENLQDRASYIYHYINKYDADDSLFKKKIFTFNLIRNNLKSQEVKNKLKNLVHNYVKYNDNANKCGNNYNKIYWNLIKNQIKSKNYNFINNLIDTYFNKISKIQNSRIYKLILDKYKNIFTSSNLIFLVKKITIINKNIDKVKYAQYYIFLHNCVNIDNIIDILSICFDRIKILNDQLNGIKCYY